MSFLTLIDFKDYFKEKSEESAPTPVPRPQPPLDTCLHLDGAPSNGPHCFADEVDIHLRGIFLQFGQDLEKSRE